MSRRSAVGLAAAGLVAAPVLLGIAYSAFATFGLAGAGAAGRGAPATHAAGVLRDPNVWAAVWWSVRSAAVATALAALAAVAVALLFRGRGRGDRAAHLLAVLPLPIPHLVAAAAAVLLLGQSGVLARVAYAAGLIHAPGQAPLVIGDTLGAGFTLTLAWKEFPFLALVTFSLLATRGPALEDAARSLGATPRQVLQRVTLPTLWRGLLPAMVVVFIVIAGSYEAGALLAGSHPQPLPVLTYERYFDLDLSRRADAYLLTLLGLLIGLVAVAVHEWARSWSEHGS